MKLLSSSYLLAGNEFPRMMGALKEERFRIRNGLSRFCNREIYHDSAPGRPLGYFKTDTAQVTLHVMNPEGNPLADFVDRYCSRRAEDDVSEISS
ncbi:MAG: hypothetical protein HY517_02000 [Candidatus Aenigmarchaeota archaeon]|nr:hypothetical protein [Candidatus Aenigmarchaeota archaeon]